jgi:hypothetical protein
MVGYLPRRSPGSTGITARARMGINRLGRFDAEFLWALLGGTLARNRITLAGLPCDFSQTGSGVEDPFVSHNEFVGPDFAFDTGGIEPTLNIYDASEILACRNIPASCFI